MDNIKSLLALIPLLPLLGFAINGIGFRRIPKSVAGIIGTATVLSSFFIALSIFFTSFFGQEAAQPIWVKYFDWITVRGLNIGFNFYIDQLSIIMLLLITGVGTLIHLYSMGYMSHDEGKGKFFAYLNLFIFSMLLLVMGSNYVIMFIGWEGVGLCSFLLIGFWNKNRNYNAAAQKAFVMNRIGDLGFLIGIFLIIMKFGSTEYLTVFSNATKTLEVGSPMVIAITMLLFVGAMGKSAQIPLYTWLPDAMAGPTPVSALIHAATMVTAGIYMVVRSNVLFIMAPPTLELIGWVGTATALLAASIGLFQNDIKKVLAYSTVSQLGFMFMALGVGAFSTGMFHVLTHAFFKALLFLAAGSVIHAMSDEQDMRKMGGLKKKLPITWATYLIATVAICGIPPFAGFFSKDEILAHVFEHNKMMWGIGMLGSFMTAFYMFRTVVLTFYGEFRGNEHQAAHLHESPLSMTIPLMILAGLSMVGGLIGIPEVFHAPHFLADFLQPIYGYASTVMPKVELMDHDTEKILMMLSVFVGVCGIMLASVIYQKNRKVPVSDDADRGAVITILYNKYFVDEIYHAIIIRPVLALGDIAFHIVEFLVIDLAVNLVGLSAKGSGSVVKRLQQGTVSFYLFAMVIGIVVFLFFGYLQFFQAAR